MKVKPCALTTIVSLTSCFTVSELIGQDYSFMDVTFVDQNVAQETIVSGINDAGDIVGTYGPDIDIRFPVKLGSKGFIRTGDNWVSLQASGMGLPDVSAATEASSINNNGVVVGQYLTANNRIHGFVYDGTFVDILPPAAIEATVGDIDDNGVIIGSYSTGTSLSAPDPNDLDVHGFRGIPDDTGAYSYQLFDFPTATSTFGNGRNNAGLEVGTGVTQFVLGTEIFGYVLPNQRFQYPNPNILGGGTQFVALNDNGVVLGNATSFDFDLLTVTLTGHTKAFLIDVSEIGGPSPPIPQQIELPCPDCGFIVDALTGMQDEPGRRAATRVNNRGQIVGFYDNNDGFLRGFIGTPQLELPQLLAGDSDQDLDFDQLDLVRVQIAAKYLSGEAATWGEGDWDGAPGGEPGSPPAGDGLFNQLDIIAAQQAALYLTGPYAAVQPRGQRGDSRTSIIYDPASGELAIDAPAGIELTSINIDSAAGIFTGSQAQNLGGSFDNDAENNIFKATFGGSFGSVSLGNVAQTALSEVFVLSDLTVVGSLAGGGDLGAVDLVYVPEPPTIGMLVFGALFGFRRFSDARTKAKERSKCGGSDVL